MDSQEKMIALIEEVMSINSELFTEYEQMIRHGMYYPNLKEEIDGYIEGFIKATGFMDIAKSTMARVSLGQRLEPEYIDHVIFVMNTVLASQSNFKEFNKKIIVIRGLSKMFDQP